jgi:hypothetical protein
MVMERSLRLPALDLDVANDRFGPSAPELKLVTAQPLQPQRMDLKVIGAGFGRTGTESLREALRILGIDPCYHMSDVYQNSHTDVWHAKAQGGDIDWDQVLGGYDIAIDWPSSSYYKELLDLNPDARVILTVRDPDAWYKSLTSVLYTYYKLIPWWRRRISPHIKLRVETMEKLIWDGVFNGRVEDADYAKRLFVEHNEEVKRSVPADRLLVFEPKQGWEPLCEFFGKPVPENLPFPHVNQGRRTQHKLRKLRVQKYMPHAAALAVVCATLMF